MKPSIVVLIFSFIALTAITNAQTYGIEEGYFEAPLSVPLEASGSFGELRSNHFHTGVDFKTQGREGLEVKASAKGYVSRIKVSSSGYGNALYIDHPNGYTTVYGHLKSFNRVIDAYLKREQYSKRLSEVDLTVPENLISINKGEVLGLSGNTGSSQGPHLHFEIRETASEYPINPLLFGFKMEDTLAPEILDLLVYKFVDGVSQPMFNESLQFVLKNGVYTLKNSPIQVSDDQIGFGIRVFDKMNAGNNTFGIYELTMEVDGRTHFQFDFDKLSFDENRFINAHIDYAEKINVNKTYQRCYKVSGNQLSIYNESNNNGIISLRDNEKHTIKFLIKDFYNNLVTCVFEIQKKGKQQEDFLITCSNPMTHFQANEFSNENISLNLRENTIYEDICFNYLETKPKNDQSILSSVFHLHHKDVPVHKAFDVAIKPNEKVIAKIRKAVICYLDSKDREAACNTRWDGQYLKTQTKNFGKYYLKLDEEKPKISPGSFKKGRTYNAQSSFNFKVEDNLSGIKSYNARLNGRWSVINLDKNQLIFSDFKNAINGKNTLIIAVEDKVGNFVEYETHFTMK